MRSTAKHTAAYRQDLRRNGFFYYASLLFIYSAMFSSGTFFVPYYIEIGYSNSQIGIIMAARSAAAIVFPPVFGMISDKIRSKRKTLIVCLAAMAVLILLIPIVTDVFLLSIIVAALYNGFGSPVPSLAETWALTETQLAAKNGSRMTYGPIRAAGSLGYSLFCLIYYLILDWFSLSNAVTFYAAFGFTLLTILLCLSGKGREHSFGATTAKKHYTMRQLRPGRLFKNYYYVTFLLIYAMMSCALNFGNNYISQLVIAAGGSSSFTGALNFVRAFLEIPIFFMAPKLSRRFGYKALLLTSCVIFVGAHVLYLVQQSILFIVLAQVLLGLSGGLMFACAISYIYGLVPRSLTATAQALSAGCNNVISMVGNLVGGYLIDLFGILSVFGVCLGILVGALLLFSLTLWLGKLRGIKVYDEANDPIELALGQ